MYRTNRNWLPAYANPENVLPKIPETRALFLQRPYLVQDFIGKGVSLLRSPEMAMMGIDYDPRHAIPCKWKCSDESLFGVDLCLYGQTGVYPFDKGLIGGYFNDESLGAAVHHGRTNVDIGGSHVGYVPGPGGGEFGRIWRPAQREYSTDCGRLIAVIAPFEVVYEDACENITLYRPAGDRVLISVPNEFLQPSWTNHHIKLLVDLQTLTAGEVQYEHERQHTHTLIGRSLFYAHEDFLAGLPAGELQRFSGPHPEPIGHNLEHNYFNIFDSQAELHEGLPREKLLLYVKFILSARHSPRGLKAAIINTVLEHNRLTDTVRAARFCAYDFVSWSGVFIDLYVEELSSYVNLFQPLGLTVKPRGQNRAYEFTPEEIHAQFSRLDPAAPRLPLQGVLGYARPQGLIDTFTYEPGHFTS